jgi:hypothetical protein
LWKNPKLLTVDETTLNQLSENIYWPHLLDNEGDVYSFVEKYLDANVDRFDNVVWSKVCAGKYIHLIAKYLFDPKYEKKVSFGDVYRNPLALEYAIKHAQSTLPYHNPWLPALCKNPAAYNFLRENPDYVRLNALDFDTRLPTDLIIRHMSEEVTHCKKICLLNSKSRCKWNCDTSHRKSFAEHEICHVTCNVKGKILSNREDAVEYLATHTHLINAPTTKENPKVCELLTERLQRDIVPEKVKPCHIRVFDKVKSTCVTARSYLLRVNDGIKQRFRSWLLGPEEYIPKYD